MDSNARQPDQSPHDREVSHTLFRPEARRHGAFPHQPDGPRQV